MQSVTYTIARPDTGAVLPYAVVTVYQQDGVTRASLFNAAGSAIGNPVDADANGAITIAAANGTYILSAVSVEGDLTLPPMTVQIFDMQGLANAIAAGGLAGVIGAKYATDADMRADNSKAAGTIALVYADTDPLKNDLYYKVGAAGSAPWSSPLGLMAGLSYSYAQAANGYRLRAGNAVPFLTRSALNSATGAVDGDVATVIADSDTHTAASGEVKLGGGAASAGVDAIPNNGRYTRVSGAWLRKADNDSQTASIAVSATRQPFGVEVYNNGAGIIQGLYNGDYNAAANYTINRFTAVMEDGTTGATADITVLVNGVAVYGPVTVTFGTKLITTPSYSMPSGADDQYLIERMTGTVRSLYIRTDGVPA